MGSPARVRPSFRALALHLREARLLREPLVHFLILGVILFAANAVLETRKAEETSVPSPSIRITAADVDWLKADVDAPMAPRRRRTSS